MSIILYRLPKKNYFTMDRIIAFILICIAITFIVWSISSGHYGIQLPVILLVPSSFYLRFRDRIFQDVSLSRFPESNRIRLITHTIFIISITLILWLSWSNLYYRPPLYFILILAAAASIILDIFYLNETKTSHITIALLKIIVLSLITYAGIYYQFPGIYGNDPWWHNEWIRETVDLGHITEGKFLANPYYLFPVFHLIGAITKIITTLPIYSSVFASVGIIMAISGIFVFLIGKKLVNVKAGLMTALIVTLTADNIERAAALIPMSLGYVYFLVILYLVFTGDRKNASNSLLIILFSLTLILTHTVAALVTLLCLIAVFISIKLYKKIITININNEAVSLPLLMLFGITMLTRWMQNPPTSSAFFNAILISFVNSINIDAQFALTSPSIVTNISYWIGLLNQMGYLLLLAFAIIGALIYLHPKKRTQNKITLLFIAGLLFVMPLGFSLFKLKNILPDRWYIFLYVPLSILAIAGSLCISNLIKSKMGALIIVMLIILTVVFTMTATNSMANDESPFVFNNAVRVGFTQSEQTAIETLSNMRYGRPITDIYYGEIFPYIIGNDKYDAMLQNKNSIFLQRNYYLYHPEWDEKYKIEIHQGGKGNYKSGAVMILDYMKEQGINKMPIIYNNGKVKAYAINTESSGVVYKSGKS